MPTIQDYMQFSLGVYASSLRNYIGAPAGWKITGWQPDKPSGFSAGCYVNGSEMVISYTGTNGGLDYWNWGIGLGAPLSQIYEAVDYYFGQRWTTTSPRTKGVSFALLLDKPCHDAHALN